MNIAKKLLLCFAGFTITFAFVTYLTSKQIEYHFANNGTIICTEHKDWGIFSNGDLVCFGIVPIVGTTENATPTPTQKLSPSGEIILTK